MKYKILHITLTWCTS